MKQVILMRTDLGMSVGKMCAQAVHACILASTPTVVVAVSSARELVLLTDDAGRKGLSNKQVRDAGHTEVPAGTLTCGSIYGDDKKVDSITGALRLL